MIDKLKQILIGRPKNPLDPRIFHQISLGAFFAWVGLGSDGLSSSCYGPEEAFLSLLEHNAAYLAIFLALMMMITIFSISASYSQIIKLFPSGGGGYLVGSKLLGKYAGLVSGCALIVDYMLTIAISIASAGDAIFSFFPHILHWKLAAEVALIVILILMNLHGIRESVVTLTPIFLLFLLFHVFFIGYGIFQHTTALPGLVHDSVRQTSQGIEQVGFLALFFIFMKAYSLGGGTYTGIEAVSNGLQILREPRTVTGRRTMLYMAISLSLTAGGLLISYLLNHVPHVAGKTMNATLLETLANSWTFSGMPIGRWIILLTLLTEGALLFVAAQTGFLDGPRVLANMAVDKWVPNRLANLSEQLVTQNGVLLMGFSSLAILLYTKGSVRLLVVFYSINVFLTFSISQLAMCRHWIQTRHEHREWIRNFLINGFGLLLTFGILCATFILKFREGAWVTLVITSSFIVTCWLINRHYRNVRIIVGKLDATLMNIPRAPESPAVVNKFPNSPTAALMVTGYNGLGIHSFLSIQMLFPNYFKNIIFLSAGIIDSARFKGAEEIDNLKAATEEDLKKYVKFANEQGLYAEFEYVLGTDAIAELEVLCNDVNRRKHPHIFFAGQLIFPQENILIRALHNQTAFALQRRLQFAGMQMVILPIRVR
jgi:amino acid transporter